MTEQPASQPQVPVKDAPDTAQERVEKLAAQLAEARAALPPVPGTVRLRVMPPHDSFTVAGFTVGAVPVPVPAGAVPQLMAAAAGAGVILEEA